MAEKSTLDLLKELRESMDNPEILDIELERLLERVAQKGTVSWVGGTTFYDWADVRELLDYYVEAHDETPDLQGFINGLNEVGNPGMVISELELYDHNAKHYVTFKLGDTVIEWDEDSKKWVAT